MNKSLLIVLLAICLVSVHAFVKRDAPAPASTEDPLKAIQEGLKSFADDFKKTLEENFNPDSLKKNINEALDKVSETFKPSSKS